MNIYRTVARISASEARPLGIEFTIQCEDETQRVFSLYLATESKHDDARKLAYAQLAQLVRACKAQFIQDSEELHDIYFLIKHNGKSILHFSPLVWRPEPHEQVQEVSFWRKAYNRLRDPRGGNY